MPFLSQGDYRVNALQDDLTSSDGTPFDILRSNSNVQSPYVITYHFPATNVEGWTGMPAWQGITSAAHQAAIVSVLQEFETIANVDFQAWNGVGDANLDLGRVDFPPGGLAGLGGWKYSGAPTSSANYDNFAVFDVGLDLAAASNRSLLLHEIGHALSLKHPFEGTPILPVAEDNNRYTVMSYTANPDNGQDSDHLMLYDIAALQARWGANMSYRTGNDLYAGPAGLIQTIWDAGGTDGVDGSGYGTALTIDLREGQFSNLGALRNLSIAFGAVIENATGGSAGDTIIGNDVANVLRGNGGNDTMTGFLGADIFAYATGADTVTDLINGTDRIDVSAVVGPRDFNTIFANSSQVGANTLINFGGGNTLTLSNFTRGNLDASDFIGLSAGPINLGAANDLNGSGVSDILWRHSSGTVVGWLLNGSGGFTTPLIGGPDNSWQIAETGDVNRDNRTDIIWRGADGSVVTWLLNGAGAIATTQTLGSRPASWKIAESGDFNNDGRSDILWRGPDGTVQTWLLNEATGPVTQTLGSPDFNWKIQGVGDFNGDGRDDILWRHTDSTVVAWLLNETTGTASRTFPGPGSPWHMQTTGDFNGDTAIANIDGGRLILQNVSKTSLTIGDFVDANGRPVLVLSHIPTDFNADGNGDILWRNADGTVSTWILNAALSFNSTVVAGPEPEWQIQNDPTGIV